MRLSELLAAALLWQSALLVNIGAPAAPEHLRFEREVLVPAAASGLACTTLDTQVLAHTASAAHNDLRLYLGYPGSGAQVETPYTLTESGPEPVADAEATVQNVGRSGDTLRFDLRMPVRTYSEVELRLRMRGFVGTAVVTADGPRGRRENLGSFGIFDLSAQELGRWTVLPMAETSMPLLHVALSLRTPAGVPIKGIPLAVIAGASVPPSRERQTIYIPVVSTESTFQQGTVTAAVLAVPAHVPVEQIRFALAPGFAENYYRGVLVRARPEGDSAAETEMLDAGAIQHVRWPSGDARLNPIDVTSDTVDATLGATLAGNARVRVLLANEGQPPLPIRSITLEMRQREVCFLATPGARYTLRYGDAALPAPVYDEAALFEARGTPVTAKLGPEHRNLQWRPRADSRPYLDRHPEVFWLLVLVCAGTMGAIGLHYVQHRGGAA